MPLLPGLDVQARRLDDLGVLSLAGLDVDEVVARCLRAEDRGPSLLVVDPALVPPSALAPLLRRGDRPGFVVEDMTDVDSFGPIDEVACPTVRCTASTTSTAATRCRLEPGRGAAGNRRRGRTPLTLVEGMHWLLQHPRCWSATGAS